MLAFPSLFHTSVAIAGLFLQVYNPIAPWCWTGTYPRGCERMSDVECIRGEQYNQIAAIYFIMVPLTIWTALLVICLLLVSLTVLQRYYASRKFALSTSTHLHHRSTSSSTMTQARRAQQVVVQCFLYSFTFLNTTIWMSMEYVFQFGRCGNGFFSFLICIRVRYLSNRAHPDYQRASRWMAFWNAVWNPHPSAVTFSALGRRRSPRMVSPASQPNTSSASLSVLHHWCFLRKSSENIVPNNSSIIGPGAEEQQAAISIPEPGGEPESPFSDCERNINKHENNQATTKDNDGALVSCENLAHKR